MDRENAGFYRIESRCIGCGTCLSVCPEGCIAGGKPPFVIRTRDCTRCARCAEKCPIRAIQWVPA